MPIGRRVVVTGLGAVSAWGEGMDALWRGLCGGVTAVGRFSRFDATSHRTRLAAEVPAPLGDGTVDELDADGNRLSLADRFAVVATREALVAAGLDRGETTGAAVIFGSSTGGMWESERFWARLTGHEAGRPSLAWITSQQYNGPGDAVARAIGARGPVETLSSACTSAALAVAAAADAVRDGEVDLALAGGSDSLCELTYAGFNSLRAVDATPCRPFRADRAGLNLGEGAAVLVLESLEAATSRGARPLAELLGGGSTCDAHHMTAPAPDGGGAARAIAAALAEAGVDPGDVDFVNAHGTGTPLNDVAEWRAIAAVLGEAALRVPLTASKSSVGHLLGAAGAIEAAITVRSLADGVVPPIAGDEGNDPEAPAHLIFGEPLSLPGARIGLSLNLAFGGSNAALVFAAWPREGG